MTKSDIGLIGLAVMGQNLVLNLADNGFRVSVYNRSIKKIDSFIANEANTKIIAGKKDIPSFCASLSSPRKIILMVKAGEVVDHFIEQLIPYLDEGDIIIDGGNSLYSDTQRRTIECSDAGILFLGVGISGGEEGARHGPSIMPGGNKKAWALVKDIFQAIAAKVDDEACCQWVGEGGAGHYVKMVHNGIEYGDMQLICEAFHIMRDILHMNPRELAEVFSEWNNGELNSYLIEITADILKAQEDGNWLGNKILDTAGQKGTGKWTGINALELGVPLTLIGEAVFARYLSSLKETRVNASKKFPSPENRLNIDKAEFIDSVKDALFASKIISYSQGFMLMKKAAEQHGWELAYGDIALMWRGGCIIRSQFLGQIKSAYDDKPELDNLLLDNYFQEAITRAQTGWRKTLMVAIQAGVPTPAMSSALAFFDGFRSEKLPANLLQAQRDYFGAHTYERTDQLRGKFFHSDWKNLAK